ncbi:MAG: hypothetical protein RL172_2530 [Bacteroidota bacterium]|jgi:hypothetical protein
MGANKKRTTYKTGALINAPVNDILILIAT